MSRARNSQPVEQTRPVGCGKREKPKSFQSTTGSLGYLESKTPERKPSQARLVTSQIQKEAVEQLHERAKEVASSEARLRLPA